jgi:hypothetical protein
MNERCGNLMRTTNLSNSLTDETNFERLHIARHINLDFFIMLFIFGLQGTPKTAHRCLFAMNQDLGKKKVMTESDYVGSSRTICFGCT